MEERKQLDKLHAKLHNLIVGYGRLHPKKHGNWAILRLVGDYFLSLDTWNSQILLKRNGDTVYNYWTGFTGDLVQNIGMDFGRFETKVNEKYYLDLINSINTINDIVSYKEQ